MYRCTNETAGYEVYLKLAACCNEERATIVLVWGMLMLQILIMGCLLKI